jgi:hypothetical protein
MSYHSTKQAIYDFFVAYQRRTGGVPPAIGDVCDNCHVARSTAKYHIDRLVLDGKLHRVGRGRRCVAVAGGRWAPPGSASRGRRHLSDKEPTRDNGDIKCPSQTATF